MFVLIDALYVLLLNERVKSSLFLVLESRGIFIRDWFEMMKCHVFERDKCLDLNNFPIFHSEESWILSGSSCYRPTR